MDIILKLKQIFNVSEIETSERRSMVSCAFAISANNLPNASSFEEFISLIPQRDEIKITFTSDSEIYFEVATTGEYEEKFHTLLMKRLTMMKMFLLKLQ